MHRKSTWTIKGVDIPSKISLDQTSKQTIQNAATGEQAVYYRGSLSGRPIVVTEEFYNDFTAARLDEVYVEAEEDISVSTKVGSLVTSIRVMSKSPE